jgi:hypothetical protein
MFRESQDPIVNNVMTTNRWQGEAGVLARE